MEPSGKRSPKAGRIDLIRSITTPLGFFVPALLIIEATIATVLSWSKLSEEHVWYGLILMLVIFAGVVVIVTFLTVFNPKNLLYGKEEHSSPALDPAGTLRDTIEDIIIENVKPECLKPSRE